MPETLVALLLAGGAGTRLYPASRPDRPKQFLSLAGEATLLEQAVERTQFADQQFVLTREAYADQVRKVAPDVGILTEPTPRDTGPALVYAAHRIAEQTDDATLLCLPTDHAIGGGFAPTARRASEVAASTDRLVTIGIEPERPETGYGYIEPGSSLPQGGHDVRQFVEKPSADQATGFVEDGWYWNAGIFAWRPQALLCAAADSPLEPLVDALAAGDPTGGFESVPAVSIDNAVLEQATNLAVVGGSFEWADLGTWDALATYLDTDADGNVELTAATDSDGTVVTRDTEGCVLAADGRLQTVGIEDLFVASYGDHTVVVDRGQTDQIAGLDDGQE